jgi:hypothetical protein
MEFRLFDDKDFKALEDTLVKAFVRAARIIARENLIQGYQPPREEAPVVEQPIAPVVVEVKEQPQQVMPPWHKPAPIPRHEEIKAKKAKQKRRSARDVCKTVASRPVGYITTDEAAELMGGDEYSKTMVGQWVLNKQITGVIVVGIKPPTKGLPGRLMVDKQAVLTRNEERIKNAQTPINQRRAA